MSEVKESGVLFILHASNQVLDCRLVPSRAASMEKILQVPIGRVKGAKVEPGDSVYFILQWQVWYSHHNLQNLSSFMS